MLKQKTKLGYAPAAVFVKKGLFPNFKVVNSDLMM